MYLLTQTSNFPLIRPQMVTVKCKDEETNLADIRYNDVGSYRKQMAHIRDLPSASITIVQID
jgi:hypothetical protein